MKPLYVFVICLVASCVHDECKTNNQPTNSIVYIKDLSEEINKVDSLDDFYVLIEKNKNILYPFFEINDSLELPQRGEDLFPLVNNVYFDSLYEDVRKFFVDPIYFFKETNTAIIKYNSLSSIKLKPKITTLVSGFFNDIIVDRNNIVVGLEYFLPPENKFKPKDLPSYILSRYTPEHLNAIVLSSYFSQFNLINELDATMLNEMISFGKLYFVISSLLNCTEERIIMGYSQEEIDLLNNNEAFIYGFFLQNELLFNESNIVKQKYISERPNTFEISQSIPGRVGRWLGLKIVDSFMKNQDYSLEELLIEKDYKKIFYNSNYNPI